MSRHGSSGGPGAQVYAPAREAPSMPPATDASGGGHRDREGAPGGSTRRPGPHTHATTELAGAK